MTGPVFEQTVRSVARALWNLFPGEGAAERINNDEIDCVCRTEELIQLIECTTERTMEKFRTQTTKLQNAKRYLENNGETVKLRIVTLHEPTPDQRSNARGLGIAALSLQEFRRGLLDSSQYIESRRDYRFGSASDPEDGKRTLPEDEYVTQPLTRTGSNESYSISDVCGLLNNKKVVVLTGPFGAGKSLTLREVFRYLRREFYRDGASPTPIAINLSDHWGQSSTEEILRRHADKIGFEKSYQLVRAWNAGQLLPLLDGIDELASPVLPMGRDAIRRSRTEALKVIQAFMQDIRGKSGILLTGRDHYFDSNEEARKLMGLPPDAIFIEVGEFSEDQAMAYLRKKNIRTHLPTWLPRKPLLLGYLASRSLLDQVTSMPEDSGSAMAWDQFLDRICEREAQSIADIDSVAIRQLLEDLATRARTLPRGSGPLYDSDLADIYKNVTGYEPLEAARTLLQRLPGLTARDQEVGARSFVDDEMMEALKAGGVARFLSNPYAAFGAKNLNHPLSSFGCSVAVHLATRNGVAVAQFPVAAMQAVQRWDAPSLALDCILAGASSPEVDCLDARGLTITEGIADEIDLDNNPVSNLTLDNCLIHRIRFDADADRLKFQKCQILRLEGVADRNALPSQFADCEVEDCDDRHTNTAIMRSEMPNAVKVLLVILRKLFLQRGSGRVDSALRRGMDHRLSPYVSPVLEVLVSEGIVFSHVTDSRTIWHGNRTHRTRMLNMLEGSINSDDPLMKTITQRSEI